MSDYYLCAGRTVIAAFTTSHAALSKRQYFAVGVHVKIKKTRNMCVAGHKRDNSQKSHGIYRRRLKPGDFTL